MVLPGVQLQCIIQPLQSEKAFLPSLWSLFSNLFHIGKAINASYLCREVVYLCRNIHTPYLTLSGSFLLNVFISEVASECGKTLISVNAYGEINGVWRLIFTFLGFCHVYTSNICINMNQNQTEVHSTDHIFHQLLFYQNIYSSPSLRWIVLTIIYQVPIAFTYLIFSNFIFHVLFMLDKDVCWWTCASNINF